MAYVMKTDEILEALQVAGHPDGKALQAQLEALVNVMAATLAQSQGIECGRASFEGTDFAGTACTFRPAYQGQPLPDCMESYDNAEEWGEGADLAEAAQGDTCTGCGRESFACSLQPCSDVIADREA